MMHTFRNMSLGIKFTIIIFAVLVVTASFALPMFFAGVADTLFASDTPIDTGTAPVQLDLNDVNAIAQFVLKFVAQQIAHPGVRQGKPAAC